MPLVSICVVVYNLEKYIQECLDSILIQDFDDYELIVVDNGSTDNSIAICEDYVKKYSDKMKFFSLPRPTVAVRGHIFAVEQAGGEYIHLMDGDDCVAAGYLKNIAKIINDKAPDLIMGGFECIVEPGATNFCDVAIEAERINDVHIDEAIDYLFSLPHLNRYVWRFIVKKNLFDMVKFDEHIAHLISVDNIKSTVWLLSASKIYYYNGPFYYYRRRIGSTVLSKNNAMTLDFVKSIIAITEIINKMLSDDIRERCYILEAPQIEWFIKLFISGYDSISYAELFELSLYIDKHKDSFFLLRKYSLTSLDELLSLVDKYGSFQGLAMYCELLRSRFFNEIQEQKEKDIYIFPTGKYGENTRRLLQDWGFKVAGFFDNDTLKVTHSFYDLPCCLPEGISDFTDEQKERSVIVISTIYTKLIPQFHQQLISAGVDEKNIFIRE